MAESRKAESREAETRKAASLTADKSIWGYITDPVKAEKRERLTSLSFQQNGPPFLRSQYPLRKRKEKKQNIIRPFNVVQEAVKNLLNLLIFLRSRVLRKPSIMDGGCLKRANWQRKGNGTM